ncbi:hypothetical protein HPP92_022809 [Vanilla planifolia]|uniref:Uncharacterized protein n=1 Tax=Vanilla planifolia TaxID=51239 RepID=A0A835PSU5_VANPL|nr:hypothetical protein HPP92_022809 [Vanilla planifolia]
MRAIPTYKSKELSKWEGLGRWAATSWKAGAGSASTETAVDRVGLGSREVVMSSSGEELEGSRPQMRFRERLDGKLVDQEVETAHVAGEGTARLEAAGDLSRTDGQVGRSQDR